VENIYYTLNNTTNYTTLSHKAYLSSYAVIQRKYGLTSRCNTIYWLFGTSLNFGPLCIYCLFDVSQI